MTSPDVYVLKINEKEESKKTRLATNTRLWGGGA